MLVIPIEIFLSHADEDKKLAKRLAVILKKFGPKVFLAHDDIDAGENWEEVLNEKITDCDIFLALLTENFHNASYTDHEVGIAYGLKKPIVPVSIGKIDPYGFMSRFQTKKVSQDFDKDEIGKLVKKISLITEKGRTVIDNLIKDFASSPTFYVANDISESLFSYPKFTKKQINDIATAYAYNNQIRGGFRSGPRCYSLIEENWKILDKDIQRRIEFWDEHSL